ncbi:unnamed protein product [Caenorhabditis brenneri]
MKVLDIIVVLILVGAVLHYIQPQLNGASETPSAAVVSSDATIGGCWSRSIRREASGPRGPPPVLHRLHRAGSPDSAPHRKAMENTVYMIHSFFLPFAS